MKSVTIARSPYPSSARLRAGRSWLATGPAMIRLMTHTSAGSWIARTVDRATIAQSLPRCGRR